MTESYEDQLSRVRMMSTDKGTTWDLSPNDQAALKSVLEEVDRLRNMVEHLDMVLCLMSKRKDGNNDASNLTT